MVRNVQTESIRRPCEEDDALDQAMKSIDPMLQLSLQREQQRRRRRLLFGGVAMLATVCGTLLFFFSSMLISPAAVPGKEALQDKDTDDKIAKIAEAEELGAEGWALWKAHDYSKAAAKFEAAVKLDSKSEAILNGLGWSQIHMGKKEEALKNFEACLELNKDHGGAINGAGQCSMALGDYVKAEEYFRRAGPNGGVALFTLAKLELLNGKFDQAKETIKKAENTGQFTEPQFAKALEKMKAAADAEELTDKYRKELEAATGKNVAKGNKNAEAYRRKGWQMFQQGKSRAAEVAFRECLKIDPINESGLNGLGFCLLNQGKHSDAKPFFETLVKINAEHGGYVNGLARCFEAEGEDDKAVKLWQTVEDGSQVTACTWGIARTLMKQKKYEDVLPYLERLKEASPANQQAAIKKWISEAKGDADG